MLLFMDGELYTTEKGNQAPNNASGFACRLQTRAENEIFQGTESAILRLHGRRSLPSVSFGDRRFSCFHCHLGHPAGTVSKRGAAILGGERLS